MTKLPSGTVSFLFTDIEGSTKLLQQLGADLYDQLLSEQRLILRSAFAAFDGTEIDTQGDSFFASFPRASDAIAAVVQIQRDFKKHDWPTGVEVRVRMGLHTGEPLVAEEGYVGMDVHRAARIAHVGHGGQVLVSDTTASLLKRDLPIGARLEDLGEYQLKDLRTSWRIFQLLTEDLPDTFPALKAKLVKPPSVETDRRPAYQPGFLHEEALSDQSDEPRFVARSQELEQLDDLLEKALSGQGQVVFISGDPGQGKTALMEHFTRQSLLKQHNLLVMGGTCDAYSGLGDPYRPFRTALELLAGDVESRWAAGAITSVQARRLWEVMPISAEAILEWGKDLLGIFINGDSLLRRLETAGLSHEGWYVALHNHVKDNSSSRSEVGQAGLFDQVAKVLRSVAERRPLVITLDDLHWADQASLDLLVQLGRHLAGAKILILGAYRGEEVALGRDGDRHPLEKVLTEFKRQYGDVVIGLDEGDLSRGQAFIEAFLDTEPNKLSNKFRESLFRQTQGHPLFTVELLRDLQERGDLKVDKDGYWVESPGLAWERLPAQVEGIIEERIGRLEEELQEILTVASIEGEVFTAQVVARVQEVRERGLLRQLNRKLDRRHRLVSELGQRQVGPENLFLYRFRHSLFQRHLYNECAEGERQLLHGEVGVVLEALYEGRTEEIASQLAWHFAEARQDEKAIAYLLEAGDQARWVYAQTEAIQHFQKAIALLNRGDDDRRIARTLIKLGQAYHNMPDYERAQQAYQDGFAIWESTRANDRSVKPEDISQKLRISGWGGAIELDPGKASANSEFRVLKQMFAGLVKLNAEGDVLPEVARAWEIQDQGKKYVFYLREDVQWSDGSPVTAYDFEFAWKRTGILEKLAVRVQVQDEGTLTVELDQPTSYFLYYLNEPFYGPVPKEVVRRFGEAWTRPENYVTNGPFTLESWTPRKSLVLIRNPFYFGHFRGNVRRIEIVHPLSPSESIDLYNSDRLDITNINPYKKQLWADYPNEVVVVPGLETWSINLNTQCAPFDNQQVRQAFAMSIDKETLVAEAMKNLARPAYGGLLPPKFPGHSQDIGLRFEPEKARHLLSQAGYPGGVGFPSIALGVHEEREYIGRFLCKLWQKHLQVDITLDVYPFSERISMSSDLHLFISGWHADSPDPANFLYDSLERLWDWRSEKFKDLVRRAQEILDVGTRVAMFQEADSVLIEEASVIPLFYDLGHWMVKPWVKFFKPPFSITDSFIDFKDVIVGPRA